MHNSIILDRRFRVLTENELEDPDVLAAIGDQPYAQTLGWAELLKHRRTVVLAEAGAGKTFEMLEQAKRLLSEDRYAFFVPLEYLSANTLECSISADDVRLLERWRQDRAAPAWFFLDARDELKLVHGKLDQALLNLARAIDGDLSRAHIILSSRPLDWQPNVDMSTFRNRLPSPEKQAALPSGDEMFARALERDLSERPEPEDESESTFEDAVTVVLLPLSARQVEAFARARLDEDVSSFLTEVQAQDAWLFARRPLDLDDLIQTWKAARRLGTRAEQHEVNVVAKLKDDPSRPDRAILTEEKARDGAERLALALVLSRKRTIRSPERAISRTAVDPDALDPATILPDWTEEERQALLRRGLFDPATFGRIRFHHRSVHEFLAASHLRKLRDKGMSARAVTRVLFAERYGERVVLPSMRPTAAWLGLWDTEVRRELIALEPEALLNHGDPASLPLSTRAELLRAFVASYGAGGSRGLNIPLAEVRRLAHPELAHVIRELWLQRTSNPDVRELLLELIWQGRIAECADIALAAALDTSLDWTDRVVAVRALACQQAKSTRKIATSIIKHPALWPDKAVRRLAPDLFPDIISVDELILLIGRTREPKSTIEGFGFAMSQIAKSIDPRSIVAAELRDKIAEQIWSGRDDAPKVYQVSGRFDYLAPALAKLCSRQLESDRSTFNRSHVRACVLASHFGTSNHSIPDEVAELRNLLRTDERFRERAFYAEIEFLDVIEPDNDDWSRLSRAEHYGLIGRLIKEDEIWLEAALTDQGSAVRRSLALTALTELWRRAGRSDERLMCLRELVTGNSDLEAALAIKTLPPQPSTTLRDLEREHEDRQREQSERRAQQLQDWNKWRDTVIADPADAFCADALGTTVRNLYAWLSKYHRHRNSYVVWDRKVIERVFGADVTERFERALRQIWRENVPIMWSAQSERHSTPYLWIYGLNGIVAEALDPNWSRRLSADEARTASAYAAIDLNQLGSFVSDLVHVHAAEVDEVLGVELEAQLAEGGASGHLPLLQQLAYADKGLKELLTPRLLAALPAIPEEVDGEAAANWAHHLSHIFRVLRETSSESNQDHLAEICHTRFRADPTGPFSMAWLRGLFQFDAEQGATALIASLGSHGDPTSSEHAVRIFAGLFGEREFSLLETLNPTVRARVLIDLVRSAYAWVQHDDDQSHEGVFSPNTRDDAETGRGYLLSALLNTPGPEAREQILALANDPNCAHFPDRLRLYARERAAIDSEFDAFSAQEIVALEKRYELPPHDRDGVFELMVDRLDDLARYLAHGDFSDRRTLSTITEEVEMQRALALRLNSEARGAYIVMREDQVADEKRTDIRLASVAGNQKAVIEVKLADRWSLAELERALIDQLVGLYMRHDACRAGCLLLTHNGKKRIWMDTKTKRRLNFASVVDYLRIRAAEIERDHSYSIRLTVFGIDLTDPLNRAISIVRERSRSRTSRHKLARSLPLQQ